MTDTAAAVEFLQRVYGPTTTAPVFISSLPNAEARGRQSGERHVLSRDSALIKRFVQKWNKEDRGVYFCVSTLKPSTGAYNSRSPRCKATVSEIALLHADIDLKSVELGLDEIVAQLAALQLPPSVEVHSGNGVHAYWLLTKSVGCDEAPRVEQALRRLADLVGGDPAVTEVSRLMRLPGTHNSKNGAWKPVTIEAADYNRRYELDELEKMVSACLPRIRRQPSGTSRLNEAANQFLALGLELGTETPINVQQRLAAMKYQGPGDSSIHQTQLQLSASLLSRGCSVDEVTAVLIDATRQAAGERGAGWDWNREERAVRALCADWLRKRQASSNEFAKGSGFRHAEPHCKRAAPDHVQGKATASRLRRGNSALDANDLPNAVADSVINALRREGHDLLLTEGEVFFYGDGVWRVIAGAEQQWLQTLIQREFETSGGSAKPWHLSATWKRITEHPELHKRRVPWESNGRLATANGVLDVVGRTLCSHSPSHYARRKISAAYVADAECPLFLAFVESLFADRDRSDAMVFVATLQCFFGASLAVPLLSREERKALILVGPSRTGKTELARFARFLVGEPVATPSVAEISDRFGLASLYDASAWIRDDAINEGDDLDPQRFKTIVTGEPIDVDRKHRHAVRGVELAIPVVLTANALPRARDKSDALFNRSLVIELTNVISEEDAFRFRTALGVPRGQTLASYIFGLEAPGILNWALDGLDRLLESGRYELPEAVRVAVQRFKDDNNPVGEWARTSIVRRSSSKVARSDLLCAFHGWQREQDGDEARALGGRGFFPRLRAAVPGLEDITDNSGRRYVGGIGLTDEGLQLWDLHNLGPQLKGGSKGISTTKMDVNKMHAGAVGSAAEAQF